MSTIDYDEYECRGCGRKGMLPDGDYDVICPVCGYEESALVGGDYPEDSPEDDL